MSDLPQLSGAMSHQDLEASVHALCAREAPFRAVVEAHGLPPMWAREPGFPTLVHIILEQQVSLASAKAAFDNLCAALDPLTPAAFLTLDDQELKEIGFSRQKTRYCRILAEALKSKTFDLGALEHQSDAEVIASMTALTGIGQWTARVYLLMVLRRPDVWPTGDIAVAQGAKELFALPNRPNNQDMEVYAERWSPYRAAAARLLWHHYLSTPRRRPKLAKKAKKD